VSKDHCPSVGRADCGGFIEGEAGWAHHHSSPSHSFENLSKAWGHFPGVQHIFWLGDFGSLGASFISVIHLLQGWGEACLWRQEWLLVIMVRGQRAIIYEPCHVSSHINSSIDLYGNNTPTVGHYSHILPSHCPEIKAWKGVIRCRTRVINQAWILHQLGVFLALDVWTSKALQYSKYHCSYSITCIRSVHHFDKVLYY